MGEYKVRKVGFIVGILVMIMLLVMPAPEGLSEIGIITYDYFLDD